MKGIDVITQAARLAGVVGAGEALQGSDPQDCLTILQDLMDSWQAERLMIFAENSNTFPLTVGKQTYTLGTGGDFNIARPAYIDRMGVQILTGSLPAEIPMNILDYNGWAHVVQKGIQANYPLNCWPDNSFPKNNLSFWVIPNTACNVVIYSWQPLLTWPDLAATDVTLPPAYSKAVKYNLAIDIGAAFHMPIDGAVAAQALIEKGKIKELNLPDPILACDNMYANTGGQGVYDWRTDQFVNQSRR